MKHETMMEIFVESFDCNIGTCRQTCYCGREFYNEDGWYFEDGELDGLIKRQATALPYAISLVGFEGKTFVQDCDCWIKRAKQIMNFINTHNHQIGTFLNKMREAAIKDAEGLSAVGSLTEPAAGKEGA